MTRVEFTVNIVALLHQMILLGEHPVIDFVKRSNEEQKRLFDAHLSQCDGVDKRSRHQDGKAMDIYFIEGEQVVDPSMGFAHWHDLWQQWGGSPEISWDRSHFEG